MRRRALIGSPLLLAAPAVQARGVIELVTAEQRPYAMAEGPEPGFVLTLVAEMFRLVGQQLVFRFLPWPMAEARAAALPEVAIAPLPRTAEREDHFLWAVALFENPNGFATLRCQPPGALPDAMRLPRVAVLSGSPQEAYLRGHGFANLAPMSLWTDALAALRAQEVAAWFGELPRLRALLGPAALFGPPIFGLPVWLAINRASQDIPILALREAYAELEADGSLAKLLRPHLRVA
jgi:polar amino acid transport system substrate-binding protein